MPATDPLAEAFAAPPVPVSRCTVGRILDEASPTARERVEAAFAADHIAINWLVTQLKRAGHQVGKETVGAHRNGSCRCVN
jgi:hypothetical protein